MSLRRFARLSHYLLLGAILLYAGNVPALAGGNNSAIFGAAANFLGGMIDMARQNTHNKARQIVGEADAAFNAGNYKEALRLFEQAQSLFKEIGETQNVAVVQEGIRNTKAALAIEETYDKVDRILEKADALFDEDKYDAALPLYKQAHALLKNVGDTESMNIVREAILETENNLRAEHSKQQQAEAARQATREREEAQRRAAAQAAAAKKASMAAPQQKNTTIANPAPPSEALARRGSGSTTADAKTSDRGKQDTLAQRMGELEDRLSKLPAPPAVPAATPVAVSSPPPAAVKSAFPEGRYKHCTRRDWDNWGQDFCEVTEKMMSDFNLPPPRPGLPLDTPETKQYLKEAQRAFERGEDPVKALAIAAHGEAAVEAAEKAAARDGKTQTKAGP